MDTEENEMRKTLQPEIGAPEAAFDPQRYASLCDALIKRVATVIAGKTRETRLLLCALAAGGHVLLEDVPGTGKTALARAVSQLTGLDFSRVQGTPDLLPSDITGVSIPELSTGKFSFQKGPVFTQILLVDELNRATPRTQAALLECMEEGQVTDSGKAHLLPRPFFVIATQNPIEIAGTFPLPEAQLDRFMMRPSLGYPTEKESAHLLAQRGGGIPPTLSPLLDAAAMLEWQRAVSRVQLSEPVCGYIAALGEHTRSAEGLRLGVSTRGLLALSRACQSWALAAGRDYVTPDDVKLLAEPVWAHRLAPCGSVNRIHAQREAVVAAVEKTPVPTEDV